MSEQQSEQTPDETPDKTTDETTDANADASETTTHHDESSGTSREDSGGSELEESGPGDVGDDKLPEDLQPTEDNPLARHPRQTGDDDDKIGADVEGVDAENPSANMTYGSNDDDSNGPSEGTGDSDAPGESDNAQVKAEEDDGSDALENGGGGAG